MIQIRNNRGQLAELYPGTSISIEKNNPLFNKQDEFFEDITYSFKMPATDANKIFFNWGHLVESANQNYEIEVQTIVDGTAFLVGQIRYAYVDDDFDALLLVNFGAMAEKVKNTLICDIYIDDNGVPVGELVTGEYMLETVTNPNNYPFAFFPVYNEIWPPNTTGSFPKDKSVNQWYHEDQRFAIGTIAFGDESDGASPYYKLKHILLKISEFLGLKATGSFIEDHETNFIYIFNEYVDSVDALSDSLSYLPSKLTITKLFKILRERFILGISFDLLAGELRFEYAASILDSDESIDLSKYISSIDEISIPKADGYIVLLKPSSKDELFFDPVNIADKTSIPTNRLLIGNQSEEIEIDASTLKTKTIADYTIPATRQKLSYNRVTTKRDYPIRFLRYTGLTTLPSGKVVPSAQPMELTLEDARWYRFLNDSKKIKLTADITKILLLTLDVNKQIGFRSKEGTFSYAIIEKLSYALENKTQELVEVSIECRTKVYQYLTSVSLENTEADLNSGNGVNPTFRAYFGDALSIEKVVIECRYFPINVTDVATITKSTDRFGVGGIEVSTPYRPNNGSLTFELLIKNYQPKFMISYGKKIYFTQRGSDFFTTSNLWAGGGFPSRHNFIVF